MLNTNHVDSCTPEVIPEIISNAHIIPIPRNNFTYVKHLYD